MSTGTQAVHPHPRTAGAENFVKQEAARRVLTMIGEETDFYVAYVGAPQQCPHGCNDPAEVVDGCCSTCYREERMQLIIDLPGLRAAIQPNDPAADFDRLVIDVAASLLGNGNVDFGRALGLWRDGEVMTFLSALAYYSGADHLEPYKDLLM